MHKTLGKTQSYLDRLCPFPSALVIGVGCGNQVNSQSTQSVPLSFTYFKSSISVRSAAEMKANGSVIRQKVLEDSRSGPKTGISSCCLSRGHEALETQHWNATQAIIQSDGEQISPGLQAMLSFQGLVFQTVSFTCVYLLRLPHSPETPGDAFACRVLPSPRAWGKDIVSRIRPIGFESFLCHLQMRDIGQVTYLQSPQL